MGGSDQPVFDSAGPDPRRVHTALDLTRELDLLRSRAAQGARRARLSLDELARRTGIPRSTVHSYIRGVRLPPPDSLDDLVIAMGADPAEQREWAEALFRVTADRHQTTDRQQIADRQQAGEPVETVAALHGRPVVPLPRQLPAAPRGLIGREDELARLTELLDSNGDSNRAERDAALVIAISGTGGIGKTALALRWAHQVADRFPDGQLWLDLRGYGPGLPLAPADALEQLLRGVGVSTADLSMDVEARAALFRSAVAGKQLLILLDNARESAQVLPLLPGTADCVTVVTSRTALRSLSVLGLAESMSLRRLPVATALSLIDAGLPAGSVPAAVTERLARHCGGLPLALRIMHERLSRTSPQEVERFADELDRDDKARLAALDLSDAGSAVSVRGALRWSYEALPADAAAMFRCLPTCWQPSFERRTAAAVRGASEQQAGRLLDQLVDAGLLDTAGPDQYRLHDLVAVFAAECRDRDEPAAELRACRERSLSYLMDITEAAIALWDPSRPIRVPRPPGLATSSTVAVSGWVLGHVDACVLAIEDAIRFDQAPAAWALGERSARAVRPQADLGALEPALRAAVASAQAADNGLAVSTLLRQLGINHGRRVELDEAERDFSAAVEWAERFQLTGSAALDRSNRAVVRAMRGDVEAGRREMTAQLPALRAGGESTLATLLSLAELELDQGDVAAAAHWSEQSMIELAGIAAGAGALAIEVRLARAQVACALGRYQEALELLAWVDEVSRERGNREYLAQSYLAQASIRRDCEQFRQAEEVAQLAVQIAAEMGDRRSETAALSVLGDVVRRSGRPRAAVTVLTRALERAEQAGLRHLMAQVLLTLALARAESDDPDGSRAAAEQARALASEYGFGAVLDQARALLPAG